MPVGEGSSAGAGEPGAYGNMRYSPAYVRLGKRALIRGRTLAWTVRPSEPPSGLRILTYHRVSTDPDPLAVPPRVFAAQMDALAAGGYDVVSLARGLEELGDAGVARRVALTFDDGYLDFRDEAAPVLDAHGFPATVFVVPGAIDGDVSFAWYRDPPPLLSWDDLHALAPRHAFEPHSLTHPDLRALDDDRAREEIEQSASILDQRLGQRSEVFCYPGGFHGEREKRLVQAAGLGYAVTVEPGVNAEATDPFAVRRTSVERGDSLLDFRARLAGAFDRPSRLRALYKSLFFGRTGQAYSES